MPTIKEKLNKGREFVEERLNGEAEDLHYQDLPPRRDRLFLLGVLERLIEELQELKG